MYMVSMVDDFEGDKRWTIAELEDKPHGLDGMYCTNFALIFNQKQEIDIDKVS